MTEMSRQRREELLRQFKDVGGFVGQVCPQGGPTVDELRALLSDSAWRERVERQVRELVEDWGGAARQLETSNGVTECDRRVSTSMRALSKELRAIVDTGRGVGGEGCQS